MTNPALALSIALAAAAAAVAVKVPLNLIEHRRQSAYDDGYTDGRSSLLTALDCTAHQLRQQRHVGHPA